MPEPARSWSFDDVPVDVEAAVPGPVMRVSELLELRQGDVLNVQHPVGENIPVFAGGSRIGVGELSHINRRLILRMVRFGSER